MGHKKGEYQYCYPNDHVNCGQSTNDVYPTTIRLALIRMNKSLVASLTGLISALRYKGEEFKDVLKMGRTQLQDAVPMTSGQEFKLLPIRWKKRLQTSTVMQLFYTRSIWVEQPLELV